MNNKLPGTLGVDRVPPLPVHLQRARDDDALDALENLADVLGRYAAPNERR